MLKPAFSVRRIGQRYDRGQVDALVERLLATVERRSTGPALTVDELRNAAAAAGLPEQEIRELVAYLEGLK